MPQTPARSGRALAPAAKERIALRTDSFGKY